MFAAVMTFVMTVIVVVVVVLAVVLDWLDCLDGGVFFHDDGDGVFSWCCCWC